MILRRSRVLRRKNSNIIKMERVLADIDYDFRNFSLSNFLKWLGEQHGTQLRAVGKKMPKNIFGAWIATSDGHYFFYDSQLTRLHQTHVILHEVCHWLCGHSTVFVTTAQIENFLQNQILIPPYDTLRRDGQSKKQEQEAETLALLIGEKVSRLKQANGKQRDQSVVRTQSENLI